MLVRRRWNKLLVSNKSISYIHGIIRKYDRNNSIDSDQENYVNQVETRDQENYANLAENEENELYNQLCVINAKDIKK